MKFTWYRITADQVVSPNPAMVGTVIVSPDSNDDRADITLHDGESAQDPKIITVRTGAGVTNSVNFQPYMQTQRGLYCEIGRYVGEVLIQLMWEKE